MDFELRTGKMSFLEFSQKNTLFEKTNYSMFHYSLRVIDEPKMSEIRILNLCHKKSILVDILKSLSKLWVTPGIKTSIRNKEKFYKRFIVTRNPYFLTN